MKARELIKPESILKNKYITLNKDIVKLLMY